MKHTTLIIVAAVLMFAASCEKKPDFVPELTVTILGNPVEQGVAAQVPVDRRASSTNVRIICNTDWEASCAEQWITLTPAEGSLKIAAEANDAFSERTALVRISVKKYDNCFREIEIVQAPNTATISARPTLIEFSKDGGTLDVTVSANCDWTASSSGSFLTLSPSSGKAGDTVLHVTASKNSDTKERQAEISFSSSVSAGTSLSVTQKPDLTGYYIDENGVNRGMGITIDGKMWAPVNCGYTDPSGDEKGNPYGKYYQWGRKIGFAYNDEGANVDTGVRNNVDGPVKSVSEAKDEEFYKNSPNWLETKVNDLWNKGTEEAPVKGDYDPCPEGWRVPTETEMLALVKNNSGNVQEGAIHGRWCSGSVEYSTSAPRIFLALAGDIAQGSNSELRDDSGFYWTSTVRTGNGDNPNVAIQIYLKGWVGMNDWTDQRARAYPIRCIAE